jgi:hypothetical protein
MTRLQKLLIALWCVGIAVPGVAALCWMTAQQRQYGDEMRRRDRDRMSATSVVEGRTEAEKTPPPGHENDVATVVKVGVYIDHISDMSIVHSSWNVSFFVWFSWKGDAPNPGESFKIINAELPSRILLEKTDNGDQHYALYKANAEISKIFNVSRFPLDEHLLTIAIEDQARQSYALTFEADDVGSQISSRVVVPGYTIVSRETVVKPHSYRSAMGSPFLPSTYRATYSQFTLGIKLVRPSWGLFFKMFSATYLSVILALVGLVVRGAGERLGMASTALFIALMNGLTISALTPDMGIATLGDEVNHLAYLAIGALIVQAMIYHRYFYGDPARENAAAVFDHATFVVVGVLYAAINAGILLAGVHT